VDASRELKALGFKGSGYPPPRYDAVSLGKVHHQVIQAVYAGEELLAYYKRLPGVMRHTASCIRTNS